MYRNDNCLALLAMMCCKCGGWQDGFRCFDEWCCKNCCRPCGPCGRCRPDCRCCPLCFFGFKDNRCCPGFDGCKKPHGLGGFDGFKWPFDFCGLDGKKSASGGHTGGVCKGCGCDLGGFSTCKRCGGCMCKLKWW
ncbi:MAG: hypothetical protein WDA65_03000 [Christensenellales bacterium]